jgi:CheY-like chemotaxis protein
MKTEIDLIFMDIQMPVMDGYEATRKIRASQKSNAKTIPIVAMTANAFAEDISLSLASGMNNHLSKPINVAELFEVLTTYLQ